ncbi:MAG TPA: PAS domain S-box protein [Bryobacteraceae bacterium]|nr:PAS domain S-box protein [Bryobacteraceae bacterium]
MSNRIVIFGVNMPNPSSRKPKGTSRQGGTATTDPAAGGGEHIGATFDDAPVPMHDIDRDGIIRRVNRAECELLGFQPHELIGRHIFEFVAAGEREASREAITHKITGAQPLAPFRREFTRRDGASLRVEIREELLRDKAGNVTGIRSALVNVSEQYRTEEGLRHAREELEVRVRGRTQELAQANEALRREVAERRRAEQRLAAQYAVARVLADSDTVDATIPRLLEAMVSQLGWDLGAWWSVDGERHALRFSGCWPKSAADAARLAASSFAPGEGVPGKVWRTEAPAWLDTPLEAAFGCPPGSGEGPAFTGGLVFPVTGAAGTTAVVVLFCRSECTRDDEMLRTVSLLGAHIAQFVERKTAETQRDRSEARFAAFMDHLPAVAYIKDTAGRYVYFNAAVESLMGYEPGSLLGRSDREIWPPEIASAVSAQDRQVIETGRSVEAVTSLLTPKVGVRSWLVYKFPVPDRDGVRYIGGIAVDVTEHRLLQDQLRQSQKMDAIGRLAGGVAHDFNNLLTIIGGYGRMILDQLPPSDRTRGSMELILNAADRAAVLTSQLLAFSRRQVVQPKLMEINHVVSNLEKMLRRVIGEHIELRTRLDPQIDRVKADSGQVEQILMNLAINARDAMPDGGVLTIETANVPFRKTSEALDSPPAPHVRLSVIDSGIGMDAQTRNRIFEPFFTTKGRGKGTGLGLSTVYGIVKQHGGEILVESEPGAGARFHIYLPSMAGEPGCETPEANAPLPASGTETILLVEDEGGVRRLARDVLIGRGYRVLEAADGQEALRVAERERGSIDLLLTDMIMPLMSGRELANRIQERYRTVRVVFMSGYTDDVIAYHGDLGPEAAFLQKPFAPDAIARKVRDVLDAGKPATRTSRPDGN